MKSKIIYCLLLSTLVICTHEFILTSFTIDQQLTLGLLLFAVYLWVAAPIPSGAGSILLLACMLLFGLVGSVEEAFSGFLSPALYFILMLSLLSYSLVYVGIDKVIARFLVVVSKRGPITLVVTMPIF
ncbi:SLC13 family permease, partial [Virgibacillus sp. DJP39]